MNSIKLKITLIITFTAFMSLLFAKNSGSMAHHGVTPPPLNVMSKILGTVTTPPAVERVFENQFILAVPTLNSGKSGSCPGAYAGYVNYTKILPTYGWSPTTGTMTLMASDPSGRTDTKVMYMGEYGDSDCGNTYVTIPYPPLSPAYRFTIFFPTNVPSTNYPIQLTGFNL